MKNIYLGTLLFILAANINFALTRQKTDPSPKDVLPVVLIYFTASVDSGGVMLNWGTATEVNNFGFEIERADSSVNWELIDFVQGAGTSSSTKHYSYYDTTAIITNLYYYRLKQIDNDGKFKYSDSVSINNIVGINEDKGIKNKSFNLAQNFPNPFNPSTTIAFNLSKPEIVTLSIYDASGRLIEDIIKGEELSSGEHRIIYKDKGLASGVYYYRLITREAVLTKKFVLMK